MKNGDPFVTTPPSRSESPFSDFWSWLADLVMTFFSGEDVDLLVMQNIMMKMKLSSVVVDRPPNMVQSFISILCC